MVYAHGEEISIQKASTSKRRLMPLVYNGSAGIIANSHYTRELLLSVDTLDEKIHVIHPGVDLERFVPVSRPAHERLRLVSVGRLQLRKGHSQVLRAVAQRECGVGGSCDAQDGAAAERFGEVNYDDSVARIVIGLCGAGFGSSAGATMERDEHGFGEFADTDGVSDVGTVIKCEGTCCSVACS